MYQCRTNKNYPLLSLNPPYYLDLWDGFGFSTLFTSDNVNYRKQPHCDVKKDIMHHFIWMNLIIYSFDLETWFQCDFLLISIYCN